jgi:two-component system, NtrC family, nitrogen regulation sensor histidine kinase NtrY
MILRLYLRCLLACCLASACAWLSLDPQTPLWASLLIGLASLSLWLALFLRGLLRHYQNAWNSLHIGLLNMADGEYAVSLPPQRSPALGAMTRVFEQAAQRLRHERLHIYQREQLLEAIFQRVDAGLLLVDTQDNILLCNPAARRLLNQGQRLKGQRLKDLLDLPPSLRQALTPGNAPSSLVVLEGANGEPQTWQLHQMTLQLSGQRHLLLHCEQVTQALARAEVDAWKNLIRLLSHELNNSLAPIASLSDTGLKLLDQSPANAELLQQILRTIQSRSQQLHGFLSAYAEFSRLPQPQPQTLQWQAFLEPLARLYPFKGPDQLPTRPGYADPTQLSQALINVLKNAHESQSPAEGISLQLATQGPWDLVRILDRGTGMSPAALQQALLPFYSTKRQGTGLGLALSREILSAHGGHITLNNRQDGGLEVCFWLPAHPTPIPMSLS